MFDSLLPEPHNATVMQLLYLCAQWHALAKLRLHNDYTLGLLDHTTTLLGAAIRRFDLQTCSAFATKELAKEAEARSRRAREGAKDSTRRPAYLSVYTIKLHFLGDYVDAIRQFGTCDSYSTETVGLDFGRVTDWYANLTEHWQGELCHRLPKSWYPRTDRKDYKHQISQIERRQARLSVIRDTIITLPKGDENPSIGADEVAYAIGENQNEPVELNLAFSVGLGTCRHAHRAVGARPST